MFFNAAYIVILCLSAGFGAWIISTAAGRISLLLKQPTRCSHGTAAVCCAIAFMVVIAAPPSVLTAAGFLLVAGVFTARHQRFPLFWRWGVPVLAVILGLSALTFAPIPGLPIPQAALIGFSGLLWLGVTLSGEALPENYLPTALTSAAALLPLTASSWLGGPSWIALDAALILSALAGACLAARHGGFSGVARIALAFLTAWLMLEATLHTAWILGGFSLFIWFCALGYAYAQDPTRYNRAFDF